ncbi:MAG: hypothetical protein AABY22_02600 [Nanoarchaeota archaeon]
MTKEHQNFIKDILRLIGKDDELTEEFAKALDLSENKFNDIADDIFDELKNERLE